MYASVVMWERAHDSNFNESPLLRFASKGLSGLTRLGTKGDMIHA
jgi:hypothetical protein